MLFKSLIKPTSSSSSSSSLFKSTINNNNDEINNNELQSYNTISGTNSTSVVYTRPHYVGY